MRTKMRLGLLIVYLAVAFGTVWFFSAGGHGSFTPIIIYTSWAGSRPAYPSTLGCEYYDSALVFGLRILP